MSDLPGFRPPRDANGNPLLGDDISSQWRFGDFVTVPTANGNREKAVILGVLDDGSYQVETLDDGSKRVVRAGDLTSIPDKASTLASDREILNQLQANDKNWTRAQTDGIFGGERKPAPKTGGDGPSGLDKLQSTLDAIGVVEPTPIADGTNAVISLLRAAMDKERRGEHLRNAGISAVSAAVPYVGDAAKLAKYGGRAARIGGAVGAFLGIGRGGMVGGGAGQGAGAAGAGLGGGGGAGLGGPGGAGGGGGAAPPGGGPGGGGGGGAGALGNAPGSGMSGALFGMFDGAIKLGVATLAAAKSVDLMNRAVIEYHRKLSGYNTQLAEAYGRLDAGRMRRSIRDARDLSGPLSGLAESQDRFEDTMQDFQNPWKVIAADSQKFYTDLLNIAVKVVDLVEPISEIYVSMVRPILEKAGIVSPSTPQSNSSGWMDEIRRKAAEVTKKGRKV